MISKILGIFSIYRLKYNRLCILYTELANRKINDLEEVNTILLQNIKYRELIDKQKAEIMKYRRKYGRIKGGDKSDKNKSK